MVFRAIGSAVAAVRAMPRWKTIPIIATILFLSMTWGVFYVETRVIKSHNARVEFHFVAQILTGNWSSPPYPDVVSSQISIQQHPLRLAVSIAFAALLNMTSFGLISVAVSYLSKLRKEHGMKLLDLTTVRDIAIRTQISLMLNQLRMDERISDEQIAVFNDILDSGFKEGDEAWQKKFFGKLFSDPERVALTLAKTEISDRGINLG